MLSNFQYLTHTGINNYDTGVCLRLHKKPSVVMNIVDFSCEDIRIFATQEAQFQRNIIC